MASSILRYCRSEWREPTIAVSPISRHEEIALSKRLNVHPALRGAFNSATDWPVSPVSDGNPSDEVYYDAPASPFIIMPPKEARIPTSSNTTRVAPPLLETNDTRDIGWQKSEPPKELFDVPYGTSSELESIVIASVERLQQQLAEEQTLRENASRVRAQELERAMRAPQLQVAEERSLSEISGRLRADELDWAKRSQADTQSQREGSEAQVVSDPGKLC